MKLRTVDDVIQVIPQPPVKRLLQPPFQLKEGGEKVVLGVASMKHHMTDEGWQITQGLSMNGFIHCGHELAYDSTDVKQIIDELDPQTLVIQDIREWDVQPKNFRDPLARFTNIEEMKKHQGIFRLTILKDSQQNPRYHAAAAEEMGCHAWIVYYHPRIVHHLAPYTRPRHLIRTYHSLNRAAVPEFNKGRRKGCLFSGAVSKAYPLRERIRDNCEKLPIDMKSHPGYHRKGCETYRFFELLSQYKVSICTSSRYGYSLRKIAESTAAGCRVITDLPVDDVMPEIDDNLIRINPDISIEDLETLIRKSYEEYDIKAQMDFAQKAISFYDYFQVTKRLSEDIEHLRQNYS